MSRATHTYVDLELSAEAFEEIRAKLSEAGYSHLFHYNKHIDNPVESVVRIEMQGIAITREGRE